MQTLAAATLSRLAVDGTFLAPEQFLGKAFFPTCPLLSVVSKIAGNDHSRRPAATNDNALTDARSTDGECWIPSGTLLSDRCGLCHFGLRGDIRFLSDGALKADFETVSL